MVCSETFGSVVHSSRGECSEGAAAAARLGETELATITSFGV